MQTRCLYIHAQLRFPYLMCSRVHTIKHMHTHSVYLYVFCARIQICILTNTHTRSLFPFYGFSARSYIHADIHARMYTFSFFLYLLWSPVHTFIQTHTCTHSLSLDVICALVRAWSAFAWYDVSRTRHSDWMPALCLTASIPKRNNNTLHAVHTAASTGNQNVLKGRKRQRRGAACWLWSGLNSVNLSRRA